MKWTMQVLLALWFLTAGPAAFGEGLSYDAFGLKLLAQSRESFPGRNIFISPVGLGFALSMALNGARGDTSQEMLAMLQAGTNVTALNDANQSLIGHLSKLDPAVKLEIANSLWTAEDAKIFPQYVTALKDFYAATAASVNFKDTATADKINSWVSGKTHGKIAKMVEPPLGANRLILLDAIYFKGDWLKPFDEKATHDAPFTLGGGQSITHSRMGRDGDFDYCQNESFQAVRLPYAGRAISMYVFLPAKSLEEFVPQLTPENWNQWRKQFRSRKGTLAMPRFKLENDYMLNDVLIAMGMRKAFAHEADFHGISEEGLYIDWVRQKTFVDVNEKGTEAAAVTGIGFRALAVRQPEPPFQMVVDRPFFIAICDNQTGAMLFLGAIIDPRS